MEGFLLKGQNCVGAQCPLTNLKCLSAPQKEEVDECSDPGLKCKHGDHTCAFALLGSEWNQTCSCVSVVIAA